MVTSIVPQNEPTELAETSSQGLAFVLPTDFPDLDNAEVGMSIEKKYFEFNQKGLKVRAVFNGMDFITSTKNGERKQIPAIVFQTKDGVYLNSGASLCEQFKNIPAGTAVQIEYIGDERTNSGNNVKKFDVRLLNVTVNAHRVKIAKAPADQEFIHPELATRFWTKANTLRFTHEEGLAHLREFGNDFEPALAALDDNPF